MPDEEKQEQEQEAVADRVTDDEEIAGDDKEFDEPEFDDPADQAEAERKESENAAKELEERQKEPPAEDIQDGEEIEEEIEEPKDEEEAKESEEAKSGQEQAEEPAAQFDAELLQKAHELRVPIEAARRFQGNDELKAFLTNLEARVSPPVVQEPPKAEAKAEEPKPEAPIEGGEGEFSFQDPDDISNENLLQFNQHVNARFARLEKENADLKAQLTQRSEQERMEASMREINAFDDMVNGLGDDYQPIFGKNATVANLKADSQEFNNRKMLFDEYQILREIHPHEPNSAILKRAVAACFPDSIAKQKTEEIRRSLKTRQDGQMLHRSGARQGAGKGPVDRAVEAVRELQKTMGIYSYADDFEEDANNFLE